MSEKPWELTKAERDEIYLDDLPSQLRAAQRKLVEWLEPQLGSDYHNLTTYITLDAEVWLALAKEFGLE